MKNSSENGFIVGRSPLGFPGALYTEMYCIITLKIHEATYGVISEDVLNKRLEEFLQHLMEELMQKHYSS